MEGPQKLTMPFSLSVIFLELKKKANRLKNDFTEGVENVASKGIDSVNELKDDLMESAQNLINDKA